MHIKAIQYDATHAWCSWWKEGIDRFPHLWTNLCKIHDVMGVLTELGPGHGVSLWGFVYTWESMGFDRPLSQEEQDAWLLQTMLDLAEHDPDLSEEERREVRMNACVMYIGLRTAGRMYRIAR